MSPWQRLGIEQNASKKDIKRAYAALVKKFRPDDSPAEFQQIREAYETMLADLAGIRADLQYPANTESGAETLPEIPLQKHAASIPLPEAELEPTDPADLESTDNTAEEVETFIARFETLIGRFPANGKLSASELGSCRAETEALVQGNILNHWWAREYLSGAVFNLLCQHIDISSGIFSTTTNMPNQFLHYLDRHFLWSENENALREWCEDDGAGLVFYCIHDAKRRDLPLWGTAQPTVENERAGNKVPTQGIGQCIRKLFRPRRNSPG